ncbi:MAG: hypothetical protein B0A82_25800 [Alkalinema sp. CACIAM 70d]|uniref:hypothetical protein n=1 Tax=Alkalinema sp. FACHB-956 TaxID=2692768 RepID=UPI000B7072F1|nr:hypothetical protein [Alkalinema sp. FACHB-956]MBD2327902.1 hypothetical protein [Alkalinema sp. FACHB-956]OUC11627.1 MAG: hypothetical protein B0A82_25800 [Alkalinema sp. CACIAM 70d]
MDCQTARQVYLTQSHLENIRQRFPLAYEFLAQQAQAFLDRRPDDFDQAVKQIVGETPFPYRVTHQDEKTPLSKDISELLGDITSRLLLERHFSDQLGQPIFFSTVCCDGHITTDRALTLEEVLPIQCAAVTLQ